MGKLGEVAALITAAVGVLSFIFVVYLPHVNQQSRPSDIAPTDTTSPTTTTTEPSQSVTPTSNTSSLTSLTEEDIRRLIEEELSAAQRGDIQDVSSSSACARTSAQTQEVQLVSQKEETRLRQGHQYSL